jgi:TIR domain/Tetratricopeptide repeat
VAAVAPIFISYSSQQRDVARVLAAALEKHCGPQSVWWDQVGLRAGDRFSPEITRALDAAKAVVVVWTAGAVASDWVYAEAVRAAARRTVVTVRAADVDPSLIPLPFNVFHTCVVDDTGAVLAAIEKRLSGEASQPPSAIPGQGFLLDPKQEALPAWAGAKGPASLLVAKHRLVPFDDIHGLRAEFVSWAIGTPAHALGSPVLGRLVHAAAGLGKTRALIEIADELTRAHGWLAGFVPRDVRGAGRELSEGTLERLVLGGRDAKGLMLIVDYAESRQDDVAWLADRLVRRAEITMVPARLVLLSRGSGVWWRELLLKSQSLQMLCHLGGEAYDEIPIPEKMEWSDRQSLFDASVRAFRAYRNPIDAHPAEQRPAPADLMRALDIEDDYDRPLAVQIAALLRVQGVDLDGCRGMAHLLELILGLEYAHWDKTLKITAQPNGLTAVRNGVAQATLVGGIDRGSAAEELIARDLLFQRARDIDAPSVRMALSLILPGANDGLAGLEPDLIGEHHVLRVVTDALVDACLDWAGADSERRRHILTVLNRATRAEHGAQASRAVAQLERLVTTRAAVFGGDLITVALETPGRLLDLCSALEAQIHHLQGPALAAIDAALPLQSLTLMVVSLRVAERLLELARELESAADAGPAVPSEVREEALNYLAARLGNLGIRLFNLGRREEALAASQEAVDIYRRLAETRPDTFLPDLAKSLNNLGRDLFNLGHRDKALAASQAAVDIYRRLVETRPDFLPDLATSLNNFGNGLSNLGRHEEALAAAQEAVDIRRRLAETRPDAFLPDLATSLNNFGNGLSNLGRHEEALAAAQEAVDIRRRLAETRPDAFLPRLATSLNNFGIRLSSLGRRQEALAVSQEAVDIYRRLTESHPDAFLPDLATSLNNFGNDLSNLRRRDEALAASQEAVDIYRRLAETRLDAFLPDLAMSLNNLGNRLSNLGRREETLAASQEAVDIRRRLAETHPDAFLPDLATSLNNLGEDLSDLGRHEEALAASQEAVDTRRGLAETRPDAFLPDLATSLNKFGGVLSNLGRHEEALAASQEAVDICRRLAEARPDAFLPDLTRSLNKFGGDLSNLGRHEEALAASQEAIDIRRRLAETRPDASLPDLATSLGALGQKLASAEHYQDAAAATFEGLTSIVGHLERHPQAFGDLARALGREYLESCERAGAEPNWALVERIARAVGPNEPTQLDSALEALKARIDTILEAAEKTGTLDEEALTELPAEIAEQLRAAWAERSV